MASRPKLRAVPDTPVILLLQLIDEMAKVRNDIAAIVGEHDCIDLAIAKKGNAFDLTIALKANTTPERTIFNLEAQPIEGLRFTQIESKPAPRAVNRKIITAKVVSPEEGA